MSDQFVIENGVLVSCSDAEATVAIPEIVTKIGKSAFKNSTIQKIVFLGSNLICVEEEAFYRCENLESIELPAGTVQICQQAFYGCSNLEYIYIPSSVGIINDDAFSCCNSRLVIIGEKGTEAEKFATKNNLVFQGDGEKVIGALNHSRDLRAQAETRTFDLWGETILCSNTIKQHHEILDYYVKRKESFFEQLQNYIPDEISSVFSRCFDSSSTLLDQEQLQLIERLSQLGVFIQQKELDTYTHKSYQAIVETMQALKNVHEALAKEVETGIAQKQNALIAEAESKITGLSYGIIGDSLSVLAYDLHNISEKKRQREEAYKVANEKMTEFSIDRRIKAKLNFNDFVNKALPILRQGIDVFFDDLFKAEISCLINAGHIDQDYIRTLDAHKSANLVNNIASNSKNATFIIALALKKYPHNMAAFVYAYESQTLCEGLEELVKFLGIDEKIHCLIKEKESMFITEIEQNVSQSETVNNAISLIQFKQYDEQKRWLAYVPPALTRLINRLIHPVEFIESPEEYCKEKISCIISSSNWERIQEYGIIPMPELIDHPVSYEEMVYWVTKQLELILAEVQTQYEEACKAFEKAEYPLAAEMFSKIKSYRDSNVKYEALQYILESSKKVLKFFKIVIASLVILCGIVILLWSLI